MRRRRGGPPTMTIGHGPRAGAPDQGTPPRPTRAGGQPTARVGACAEAFSPKPYWPCPPPFCSTRASTVAIRPVSESTLSTVLTVPDSAVSPRITPTVPVGSWDPERPATTTPVAVFASWLDRYATTPALSASDPPAACAPVSTITDCPAAGVPVTVMNPADCNAANAAAPCSALATGAPPAGAISTEDRSPPTTAPACGTSGS